MSDRQPKPHDPPRAGTAGQQLTEPCLSRNLTTADTFPSHPCSPQQLQDSQTPMALCLLLQQHLGTVPLAWQTCSTVPSCTAAPPDLQSQGSSTCYTNCKQMYLNTTCNMTYILLLQNENSIAPSAFFVHHILFPFIFRTQVLCPPRRFSTQGKCQGSGAPKSNTTTNRFSLECLKLFARQHIKTARAAIKSLWESHCPSTGAGQTVRFSVTTPPHSCRTAAPCVPS